MKLAVANWFPYRHQATALQQLLAEPQFEILSFEDLRSPFVDKSLGPFIMVVDGDEGIPIMGVPAIVEALDRSFPGRGILGDDALSRARVRAFAAMIEERFSRLCMAAMPRHAAFGRRIWLEGSEVEKRILSTPPLFRTVEVQLATTKSRYIGGERPSLADCLLAALWWTAEDLDAADELREFEWISAWHARNCNGDPFAR